MSVEPDTSVKDPRLLTNSDRWGDIKWTGCGESQPAKGWEYHTGRVIDTHETRAKAEAALCAHLHGEKERVDELFMADELCKLPKTELVQRIRQLEAQVANLQRLNTILIEDVPRSISQTLRNIVQVRQEAVQAEVQVSPPFPSLQPILQPSAPTNLPAQPKLQPTNPPAQPKLQPLQTVPIPTVNASSSSPLPSTSYDALSIAANEDPGESMLSLLADDVENVENVPQECVFLGEVPQLSANQRLAVRSAADWKKLLSTLLNVTYSREQMSQMTATRRSHGSSREAVMSRAVRDWIIHEVRTMAQEVKEAAIIQKISQKFRDGRRASKK